MKVTEIIDKIKDNKKYRIAIIGGILILAAIIYFLPSKSNKSESKVINNNTEISKNEQLEKVLSGIKGCGKVSVMITYESDGEIVCASTTETQTDTVREKTENGGIKESETTKENKKPVTVGSGNGENALVVLNKVPKVKGVIVVAQGAENLGVKLSLQKAVETVLQVSPEQVEIFAMN